MQKGKKLLRQITIENANKIFFADEKLVKLYNHCNTQNDYVYTHKKEEISGDRLLVRRSSFPKKVLRSAGVFKQRKISVFC